MKSLSASTITLLSLFLVFFFPGLIAAQGNTDSPHSDELKLKSIEIEYHTLGGLQYSMDGRFLTRYQDFQDIVLPLRDYETERLLKRSETSEVQSQIFGVAGFVGLVTGVAGLLTSSSNQQAPFWVTAIGGGILIDIGGLFQTEAQTTKFNCIQRYNRFARGEEQILPKGPVDEKSLLNFGSEDNAKAPKEKDSPQ